MLTLLLPAMAAAGPYQDGKKIYRKGQYQESVALFLKAIKKHPGRAKYHYHLGLAYLKLKNYKSALASFKKALKLDKAVTFTDADKFRHKMSKAMHGLNAGKTTRTPVYKRQPIYNRKPFRRKPTGFTPTPDSFGSGSLSSVKKEVRRIPMLVKNYGSFHLSHDKKAKARQAVSKLAKRGYRLRAVFIPQSWAANPEAAAGTLFSTMGHPNDILLLTTPEKAALRTGHLDIPDAKKVLAQGLAALKSRKYGAFVLKIADALLKKLPQGKTVKGPSNGPTPAPKEGSGGNKYPIWLWILTGVFGLVFVASLLRKLF